MSAANMRGDQVAGVVVDGERIEADAVVGGAWTADLPPTPIELGLE